MKPPAKASIEKSADSRSTTPFERPEPEAAPDAVVDGRSAAAPRSPRRAAQQPIAIASPISA